MIRTLLGVSLALCLSGSAIAQVTQTGSVSVNSQTVAPTPVTQFNQACNGGAGGIVGQVGTVNPYLTTICAPPAAAPGGLTSTGYQQIGPITVATGFTPPSGSTVCYIQVETNAVRYRSDGVNPTAAVGMPFPIGWVLVETASLSTIRFIPIAGTSMLDVDCYRS